jgi:ParB family chromosome partitioning protein
MPDPDQPRTQFDQEQLERLAQSIQSTGQLHPIRVRWDAERDKWLIVTGERRWRATRLAGLNHIDCYFHEAEATDSELLEQQLVENLLREDLKPIEEAKAYAKLMELNGWNGKQVAESLHISSSKVSRAVSLLDLPEDIQRQVETGEIPKTTAYELTKLKSEEVAARLAEMAATDGLSHKQVSSSVKTRRGKKTAKRRTTQRQSFKAENGLTVTISAKSDTNYHEIEEALQQALDEVRHRIENNVQLF